MKRSAEFNMFSFAKNNCKRSAVDFDSQPQNSTTALESSDMKHLGGNNFVCVNHFLGLTRDHIRRFVFNGELQPTKDGVSLSPKTWHSLCGELKTISNHNSLEKMFVIEKDLCIFKQIKDGVTTYVFQCLFQRKNFSMQFVPKFVVLNSLEFGKLYDNVSAITNRLKETLITYSVAYFVQQELDNPNL